MEDQFTYDVAFSFLKEDEGLVNEVNLGLRDRYKTFIYSEHQDILAGNDGEVVFNEVFGQKARVVIIFYRPEWGTTAWTRIEQTAIKNRTLEDGYGFCLFVQMSNQDLLPKWLPKTQIYLGLERFGIPGIQSVVENKIVESGGTGVVVNANTQFSQTIRVFELQSERQMVLGQREAYDKFISDFESLSQLLLAKAREFNTGTSHFSFSTHYNPNRRVAVSCNEFTVRADRDLPFGNSLLNSNIKISLLYFLNDNDEEGSVVNGITYIYDYDPVLKIFGWRYQVNPNGTIHSADSLVDYWMREILKSVMEHKKKDDIHSKLGGWR